MGGIGSGRNWYWGAKDTTDDYRSIDVRRWKRDGLLAPYQSFSWQWSRDRKVMASICVSTEPGRVMLTYRHRSGGGEWEDESYPVYLDWTSCNLSGQRPWFLCPANDCSRRVALLYGGGIFACRHCHQLTYQSQREDIDDRLTRKADKIRARLGWEPGILNLNGFRPKGMHWKTYRLLARKHSIYVDLVLQSMSAKYGDFLLDLND